jgi:hypothetical protein
MATISEAICSIMWAGMAALVISRLEIVAIVPALVAAGMLAAAYALSPKTGALPAR